MAPTPKGIPTSTTITAIQGLDANGYAQHLLADDTGALMISGTSANIPTLDAATGSLNSTAPLYGMQIGGEDGSGKLQALKVDGSGNLLVATTGGGGASTVNQGTASAGAKWSVEVDNSSAIAVTDSAAETSLATIAGAVSASRMAVTGTFWQATQPVSGTVTAAQATAANLNATVVGTGTFAVQEESSGATAATAPSYAGQVGGVATTTTLPTAVSSGQLVGVMTDKVGRVVTTTGTPRSLVGVQTTTIASSSSETTIVTAGASGVFNDISSLIITTSTATAHNATLKDSTGGTTRAIYDIAANGGIVINFPVPLPQSSAAANWTITLSSAAVTDHIQVVYLKNS